ncbi:MAG: hypothetical protein H6R19_2131 [Proteobacteria bacterium]|nr:hypothetical protein [Pseudomonadota bacterium]
MALLDWFRQSTPKIDEEKVSTQLVEETIDYVVKMTDARLTLINHYRQRLTGPVTRSLQYLNALRTSLPPTHEVAPLSWSLDPTMRAFYGQPADLINSFAHCQPLHNYAATASPLDPVYAVLAMDIEEQQRFGVGMQGDMVVRDVAQSALSFSHHRLRLFARSETDLRRSIARRMLDELALIALDRMQDEQSQRRELAEHRNLLAARLSTFAQRGAGAESFLGEAGAMVSDEESSVLLRRLEENETQLAALGCPTETLDHQLDYLAEVLAEPMRFIQMEYRQQYLDSMNMIVDEHSGERIEFCIASVVRQPPKRRAFLPVRIDRALIGEGRKLHLDNAERWL